MGRRSPGSDGVVMVDLTGDMDMGGSPTIEDSNPSRTPFFDGTAFQSSPRLFGSSAGTETRKSTVGTLGFGTLETKGLPPFSLASNVEALRNTRLDNEDGDSSDTPGKSEIWF